MPPGLPSFSKKCQGESPVLSESRPGDQEGPLGPGQMPDGDSHLVTLGTRAPPCGLLEGMRMERKAGGVGTLVKNPECDVSAAGLSNRHPGGHMLGHHHAGHLNSGWE